jgi:hypothetical protein
MLADLLGLELWVEPAQEEEKELPDLPGVGRLQLQPLQVFLLKHTTSVADPGCLSRIPDPDFYPSRIPDPGSRIQKQQQKREVKKNYL